MMIVTGVVSLLKPIAVPSSTRARTPSPAAPSARSGRVEKVVSSVRVSRTTLGGGGDGVEVNQYSHDSSCVPSDEDDEEEGEEGEEEEEEVVEGTNRRRWKDSERNRVRFAPQSDNSLSRRDFRRPHTASATSSSTSIISTGSNGNGNSNDSSGREGGASAMRLRRASSANSAGRSGGRSKDKGMTERPAVAQLTRKELDERMREIHRKRRIKERVVSDVPGMWVLEKTWADRIASADKDKEARESCTQP